MDGMLTLAFVTNHCSLLSFPNYNCHFCLSHPSSYFPYLMPSRPSSIPHFYSIFTRSFSPSFFFFIFFFSSCSSSINKIYERKKRSNEKLFSPPLFHVKWPPDKKKKSGLQTKKSPFFILVILQKKKKIKVFYPVTNLPSLPNYPTASYKPRERFSLLFFSPTANKSAV